MTTEVERLRAEAEAAEARAVAEEAEASKPNPASWYPARARSVRKMADAAWKALAVAEKKAEAAAIPPLSDGWDDDPLGGTP